MGRVIEVTQHDDDRLERIDAALAFVPISQYDEVTKLAENAVSEFITDRDSYAARLAAVEAERDAALGDLDNHRLYVAEYAGYAQIAKDALAAAEDRVEALETALRDVLDNIGGHGHWREGGAGGRCETCVRQDSAAGRARAALSSPPSPQAPVPEQERNNE